MTSSRDVAVKLLKGLKNPNGAVVSWGEVCKDGKLRYEGSHVCYANLDYHRDGTPSFHTLVVKTGRSPHITEEVSKTFLQWFLKDSPWSKTVFKEQAHQDLLTDVDFVYKHGLVFDNLDVPGNLLVNSLFAHRYWEDYVHTNLWYEIVQLGGDPTIAFILSHMIPYQGGMGAAKIRNRFINTDNNHCAIDPYSMCQSDVENFFRANVAKPNSSYAKAGKYRPCNKVWGRDGIRYQTFLVETYPEHFKKAGLDGRFASAHTITFTPEDLAAVANKEAERIKNLA